MELVAPYYARLVAYPKAWSPATAGVVRGTPVLAAIRNEGDLAKHRGRLRGKIVLGGAVPDSNRFAPTPPLGRRAPRLAGALHRPGAPRSYWDDAGGYAENVRRRQRFWPCSARRAWPRCWSRAATRTR